VLYLDTGCLVKLYYPEWNSPQVVAAVAGESIGFTALHDLELTSAFELKVFRGEATANQAQAARQAVSDDLAAGKLVRLEVDWNVTWAEAGELARRHSAATGARSLDILHCAVVKMVGSVELLTTDARQIKLAQAGGLPIRLL
jgi:predicted nucleic acid-binding protein